MDKIIFPDWFQDLHPNIQHILQYGPQKPYTYIRYIYHLSPDEIREAATNPNLQGMLVYGDINDPKNVEQQLKNLIRKAAWLNETFEKQCVLQDFSNKYKIVRHYGNKAVVLHWSHDQTLIHQSYEEFKKSQIDRFVAAAHPKTGEWERHPAAPIWLQDVASPRFEYAEFLPGKAHEEIPEGILNLWRGWPCRTDIINSQTYEPEGCRKFLDHMRDNLCNGNDDVYIYLLGWMADALLNPYRTSEVAIVMQGPQGSGKSMWAKLFMELFYPHVLTLNQPGQVTGGFNKHLQDKCIVFADEAFFAGNRKDASTLKTLITDDEIFIEPKGVDGFMAKKCFRMIIASNDEHVIRADVDDRRYLVLRVDAGENNQNPDYFGAIYDEWHNGGKQALFSWLRGLYWKKMLQTGAWDVRLRPKTKALQAQKDLSLPLVQAIVHQMLYDGELPDLFKVNQNDKTVFVATRLLAETRRLEPKDETALGHLLSILAGDEAQSVRVYLDDKHQSRQYRGYWLPSLELCRQRWSSYLARSIEWPKNIDSWGLDDPPTIPF